MSAFPPIRKAVFPVAGLGTRFLPATKSVPKELLPVVDKPLIQHAVEEAIDAGADTIIFVTRGDKQAITRHFMKSPGLEQFLEGRGSARELACVRDILPAGVSIHEALQEEPLGLGHAVLCARELVADEPFFVILPDDLIRCRRAGCLSQMRELYEQTGHAMLGVEEIAPEFSDRYGIVEVREAVGQLRIESIIEKPRPEDAPSNLGVVGRYLLPAAIFPLLENLGAGAGGEIQLTDGIARLLRQQPVLAFRFAGQRFDCGSRLGLVQATIDRALEDAGLAAALREFLAQREAAGRRGGGA